MPDCETYSALYILRWLVCKVRLCHFRSYSWTSLSLTRSDLKISTKPLIYFSKENVSDVWYGWRNELSDDFDLLDSELFTLEIAVFKPSFYIRICNNKRRTWLAEINNIFVLFDIFFINVDHLGGFNEILSRLTFFFLSFFWLKIVL